jgi:FkbM family methyltransferase
VGLVRELYRRWLTARHRPRHWTLRAGTLDRRIFLDVLAGNEYRLPRRFAPSDVILDVGAHIGSFSLAALRRGAGRVIACEPFAANHHLLEHNLRPYRDRVTFLRRALYCSGVPGALVGLANPLDPRNTGAPRVRSAGGEEVATVGLDELVELAGGRVRLAKLDCEGAEWPALLTASRLGAIEEICGEYHLGDFADAFRGLDFPPFTLELLRDCLGRAGFEIELAADPRSPFPVGLFFARRYVTSSTPAPPSPPGAARAGRWPPAP